MLLTQSEEERREDYIKQALILFLKKGIRNVTIGDITNQLNVSSKTVYRLFVDKIGLVDACLEMYEKNMHSRFNYMLKKKTDEPLENMVTSYHQLVIHLTKISPSFVEDIDRYFSDSTTLDNFLGKDVFRETFQLGQSNGYIRPELNVELIADTLVRLIKSYFYNPIFFKLENPQFHFFRSVVGPNIVGIFTREAIRRIKAIDDRSKEINPNEYVDTGILL